MTRRAAPDVVYSTMGQSSLSDLTLDKPYRWRGVEGWTPGDVRFREEPGPSIGGETNTRRKNARLERFGTILARISGTGPEHADIEHIRRAGELVGVGEKTARAYLRALLRREENTP